MAILNYTTKVPVDKTVAEIQKTLGSKGARSITTDYDAQGRTVAITFMLHLREQQISFRLPVNPEGVFDALYNQKGVEKKYKTREHARLVAWRILKDWIEAQLAIVEANQAKMVEVFLPYALDNKGLTFFQAFEENTSRNPCEKKIPGQAGQHTSPLHGFESESERTDATPDARPVCES
jgi:hypothetical protein